MIGATATAAAGAMTTGAGAWGTGPACMGAWASCPACMGAWADCPACVGGWAGAATSAATGAAAWAVLAPTEVPEIISVDVCKPATHMHCQVAGLCHATCWSMPTKHHAVGMEAVVQRYLEQTVAHEEDQDALVIVPTTSLLCDV